VENTAGYLRCPERTAELGESNAEHVGPGGGTKGARGNWTYDDDILDSVAQRALSQQHDFGGGQRNGAHPSARAPFQGSLLCLK